MLAPPEERLNLMRSLMWDYKSLYLNHRFSDDLDFFVNSDPGFTQEVNRIYKRLIDRLPVNTKSTVDTKEFVRIWIGGEVRMKLERIADDFLLARDNSLGADKIPIEKAKPKL